MSDPIELLNDMIELERKTAQLKAAGAARLKSANYRIVSCCGNCYHRGLQLYDADHSLFWCNLANGEISKDGLCDDYEEVFDDE